MAELPSLIDLIRHCAQQHPHHSAIVFNQHTTDYAELDRITDRAAAFPASPGIARHRQRRPGGAV